MNVLVVEEVQDPTTLSHGGKLKILLPEIVANDYKTLHADFGTLTTNCVPRNVSIALPLLACAPITNINLVKDSYTLIERGTCTFYAKVRHAFEAGAKGVIVINTEKKGISIIPGGHYPTDDIDIPVVMVDKSDGKFLYQLAAMGELNGIISSNNEAAEKCGTDQVEVSSDGGVINVKLPIEETITEKSGKRTNPSKEGLCGMFNFMYKYIYIYICIHVYTYI